MNLPERIEQGIHFAKEQDDKQKEKDSKLYEKREKVNNKVPLRKMLFELGLTKEQALSKHWVDKLLSKDDLTKLADA